jgi:hypothetical protein
MYASLFHDFDHSGGELPDNLNIDLAIKGFVNYVNKYDIIVNVKRVSNIIRVTEFPHVDMKLTILQKIIRDADVLGGVSDDWVKIVSSLAAEYDKTLLEFMPIQLSFLDNIKFNLPYSVNMLNNNKNEIKKELQKLKNKNNE